MIKSLLLVFIGGGIGSGLRYLISLIIQQKVDAVFPWGTFVVNALGCLIIGVLLGILDKELVISSDIKLFFITGFCGGFTTFSTFTADYFSLFESNNFTLGLLYIAGSIVSGFIALWIGISIIKNFAH